MDASSRTGLRWIAKASSNTIVGSEAMASTMPNGYYRGRFAGKYLLAHRVVFYLTHGYWPTQVDHIDGNRANNHPDNLREVTAEQNQHNRVARGYYLDKRSGKWLSKIRVGNKVKQLGLFNTEDAARAAYLNAKRGLHPTAPERCYESS